VTGGLGATLAGVLDMVLPESAVVIEAAVEWVERIHGHPNLWADEADHALIAAVKALTGATYPWETPGGTP
jgi:hypothetical protein